jgi:hypothetical protein
MADVAFMKGVSELYQGEALGEVVFGGLLKTAENDEQRYKLGTMLQLETETKARLRPLAFRHGLDLAEDPAFRAEGMSVVEGLSRMSWQQKMQSVHDVLRDRYIPRYKEITAIAPAEDREIAESMVEHETALFEMARRELSGMSDRSAEPVVALLKYPLPRPA